MGCYGSESSFDDKIYGGGYSGSSLEAAIEFGNNQKKKYIAIARAINDGHSFAFNILKDHISGDDGTGCERECTDTKEYCGCTDQYCKLPAIVGESNNRRWAVYKLK